MICDTYTRDQNNSNFLIPHETNNRAKALEIFNKYKKEKPMYGIEQEFRPRIHFTDHRQVVEF